MFCRFCGKQIADDAEYCSYCGRKVLRVPPVFTMTDIGTGVATDAIRNYSEWGFYNNPDAELDPETGQRREAEFDTLKTLPEENPIKWARDFMEADKAETEEPESDEEELDYEEADDEDVEADVDAPSKRKMPVAVIVIALVLLAAAIAGGAYLLFGGDKDYEVDLNSLMNEPKVISLYPGNLEEEVEKAGQ